MLLGQTLLSKIYSMQAGKLLIIAEKGYFPVINDLRLAWDVIKTFDLPEGFHDLEDEDHDRDILACWSDEFDDDWGKLSFIDEPNS